ncbi:MAG: FkbM family methyltransferase [Pseudomonadota bacterium]
MNTRYAPQLADQVPRGLFEMSMAWGMRNLPQPLAYRCFRKFKRRMRWRNEHTFDALLADLRPGDVCVDLGANEGVFTNKMADKGATVFAFEPDPDTFSRLSANVGDRTGVTLFQKAAGAQADTLTLYRSARLNEDVSRHSQAASLVRQDRGWRGLNADDGVAVDVVDFPAWLAAQDTDVRLLKIDIEGSEWDLIPRLIDHPVAARIDAIFVETHEWMDVPRYMPLSLSLQARALKMQRPYLNLFWV